VSGDHRFVAISAGAAHTCAVDSDGILYCWGRNDRGQLGPVDGLPNCGFVFMPCALVPAPPQVQVPFVQISAGGLHTCGLTAEGAAYCWGANRNGQLGNEGIFDETVPQRVAGGLRFVEIHAGQTHTCARTDDDEIYCWGDNFQTQLGNGRSGVRRTVPSLVEFGGAP
jgi:alpha-tubulin suppressor-like RCC1 family protein